MIGDRYAVATTAVPSALQSIGHRYAVHQIALVGSIPVLRCNRFLQPVGRDQPMRKIIKIVTLFFVILLSTLSLKAEDGARIEQVINTGFSYRNLGPFRVSGWVSDIAVPETPDKAHLYS